MLEETNDEANHAPIEGAETLVDGGEIIAPGAIERELKTLAGKIKREHGRVRRSLRTTLESAIKAGQLLLEAKEKVGHGGWLAYLNDECGVHQRVARRYMAMAKKRDLFLSENGLESDLSLAEAARLIVEAERDEELADWSEEAQTETSTETSATATEGEVKGEQDAPFTLSSDSSKQDSSKQAASRPKAGPAASSKKAPVRPAPSKDQARSEPCVPFVALREAIAPIISDLRVDGVCPREMADRLDALLAGWASHGV